MSIPDIPVLISGKTPTPDCVLEKWVFENFILADEPSAKALQTF